MADTEPSADTTAPATAAELDEVWDTEELDAMFADAAALSTAEALAISALARAAQPLTVSPRAQRLTLSPFALSPRVDTGAASPPAAAVPPEQGGVEAGANDVVVIDDDDDGDGDGDDDDDDDEGTDDNDEDVGIVEDDRGDEHEDSNDRVAKRDAAIAAAAAAAERARRRAAAAIRSRVRRERARALVPPLAYDDDGNDDYDHTDMIHRFGSLAPLSIGGGGTAAATAFAAGGGLDVQVLPLAVWALSDDRGPVLTGEALREETDAVYVSPAVFSALLAAPGGAGTLVVLELVTRSGRWVPVHVTAPHGMPPSPGGESYVVVPAWMLERLGFVSDGGGAATLRRITPPQATRITLRPHHTTWLDAFPTDDARTTAMERALQAYASVAPGCTLPLALTLGDDAGTSASASASTVEWVDVVAVEPALPREDAEAVALAATLSTVVTATVALDDDHGAATATAPDAAAPDAAAPDAAAPDAAAPDASTTAASAASAVTTATAAAATAATATAVAMPALHDMATQPVCLRNVEVTTVLLPALDAPVASSPIRRVGGMKRVREAQAQAQAQAVATTAAAALVAAAVDPSPPPLMPPVEERRALAVAAALRRQAASATPNPSN